jgi:GDP-D-mannose dehydratase
MKKKALVIGGTGQIGAYQCKLLLKKNYKVYVTTRKLQKENNLKKLKILKKLISFNAQNILKKNFLIFCLILNLKKYIFIQE